MDALPDPIRCLYDADSIARTHTAVPLPDANPNIITSSCARSSPLPSKSLLCLISLLLSTTPVPPTASPRWCLYSANAPPRLSHCHQFHCPYRSLPRPRSPSRGTPRTRHPPSPCARAPPVGSPKPTTASRAYGSTGRWVCAGLGCWRLGGRDLQPRVVLGPMSVVAKKRGGGVPSVQPRSEEMIWRIWNFLGSERSRVIKCRK